LPSSPSSSEDAGAESLLDSGATLLPGTSAELPGALSELDAGASLELDPSLNTGAELEVPAEDISEEEGRESSAFASPESSPQATRNAVKSAHKKTSERNLIQNNIKKIPDQVGDDILGLISVDLTSLGTR
jgi:hypothetical protein